MSILNKFSLEGKTALVTGCKRGIGKAKLKRRLRRPVEISRGTAVPWAIVKPYMPLLKR